MSLLAPWGIDRYACCRALGRGADGICRGAYLHAVFVGVNPHPKGPHDLIWQTLLLKGLII